MTGAAVASGSVGIVSYPDIIGGPYDSATYTLKANGSIIHDQDTTGNLRWVVNTAPTNYEVRFTPVSTGVPGSWLDFTADRTISTASLVEIRDKYTAANVVSVTITI